MPPFSRPTWRIDMLLRQGTEGSLNAPLDFDGWVNVLDLATTWNMEEVGIFSAYNEDERELNYFLDPSHGNRGS